MDRSHAKNGQRQNMYSSIDLAFRKKDINWLTKDNMEEDYWTRKFTTGLEQLGVSKNCCQVQTDMDTVPLILLAK